ncbi:hypothetical protein QUB60_09000 [Microcoleus sp. A2-C5]|uniref:hypothetical protein n=1 Tax=unclassified Microcoleus TaxID=2642155 RepID=UPI002FD1C26F
MTFTGYPNSAPVLLTTAEAAVAKTSSRALASHLENYPSGESLKSQKDYHKFYQYRITR